MSTHARPLADWLAAASDAELISLFRLRGVREDVGWQDFFDAAEALLDVAAVTRALALVTLPEARALERAVSGGDAGDHSRSLIQLALLRPDGTVAEPVVAALRDRTPVAEPDAEIPQPSTESTAAHAAERAFTTVAAVADVLLAARDSPLSLLSAGGLSAVERKQLSEVGIPADSVAALTALGIDAGLLVADDRLLRATHAADDWLHSPFQERWVALVSGFLAALPRGMRATGGGWIPAPQWPSAHPWSPDHAHRSARALEHALLLGLTAADGSEPEWAASARDGGPLDADSLVALLPAAVDRIFVQADLTAIAPGPLDSALDVRLRTIAIRESSAQASTYRFTAESIARALVGGESAASILEFLRTISLTGIPQPLEYLVERTAQRHGLVRVSTDQATGRTRIESEDRTLLDALSIDQTLRPLALTRQDDALATGVRRDTVYWALTDARYPATLVDADGSTFSGDRHPPLDLPTRGEADYSTLLARLRSHQGPDADAAWLDRELEAAVRSKAVLQVTVGLPDGSTRELILEATGLGGGRLRGRDRAADVERTLPVSSIRSAVVIAP